jgi:hypothetical protein
MSDWAVFVGPSVLRSLVGAAAIGVLAPVGIQAQAQEADAQMEKLEQQIEELQRQLEDLRDQVARQQTPPPSAAPADGGKPRFTLDLSGQIDQGILVADDGQDTNVFFVDNSNSSSRFRMVGEGAVTDDVTAGTNLEVQIQPNASSQVSQNDQNLGSVGFTARKVEFYFDHDRYGKVWVGQGDTASNNTAEVDLSGTSVVGYSSVSDMAGGILFRDQDGVLSDTAIGDVFSNFDGLSRQTRVRYDTPRFYGLQASTSAISDRRWDAALTYAAEIFGAELAAAGAYAYDYPNDSDIVDGSISVLLGDNAGVFEGVSLTFSAGSQLFDESGRDNPVNYYGKLGYQFAPLTIGTTAFSADFGQTNDLAQNGDEAKTFGVQAVQAIDAVSTDLYLGYRHHKLDRDDADFQNVNAVLTGGRVKF